MSSLVRRAETKKQAGSARHENEPKNPARRKFLIGLGAIGVLVLLRYGAPKIIDFISPDNSEEPSGEINEVKYYLRQWEDEVGSDKSKLEKKLPQIARLAAAYFSVQMMEMFPERKADYDKENFKDKVIFMDKNSFEEKKRTGSCGVEDPSDTDIWAFVDTAEDNQKIYFNKDFNFGLRPVPKCFEVILHELTHLSAHKRVYVQPIVSTRVPASISYEQGLTAYVKKDELSTPTEKCFTLYRSQAEETVVDHNARKLFSLLGLTFHGGKYEDWVNNYNEQVINRLYGGNYKELLGYQQLTQPTEFFRSIGRKLIGGTLNAKVEEEVGSDYMIRLLS